MHYQPKGSVEGKLFITISLAHPLEWYTSLAFSPFTTATLTALVIHVLWSLHPLYPLLCPKDPITSPTGANMILLPVTWTLAHIWAPPAPVTAEPRMIEMGPYMGCLPTIRERAQRIHARKKRVWCLGLRGLCFKWVLLVMHHVTHIRLEKCLELVGTTNWFSSFVVVGILQPITSSCGLD